MDESLSHQPRIVSKGRQVSCFTGDSNGGGQDLRARECSYADPWEARSLWVGGAGGCRPKASEKA